MKPTNPIFALLWSFACWLKDRIQRHAMEKKWGHRYSFGISQTITLGTPCAIHMQNSPSVAVSMEKILGNAPCPGFVLVNDLQVGAYSETLGDSEDLASYSAAPLVIGKPKIIQCQHRLSMAGQYTGVVPPGYKEGDPFTVCLRVEGCQGLSDV